MKEKRKFSHRKILSTAFLFLIICFNLPIFFTIIENSSKSLLFLANEKIPIKQSAYFDYLYYKNIVIDHDKVEGLGTLLDFPVLISLLDSDLKNHAQLNGNDIAFFIGTTQLDHEIESYNPNYSQNYAQLVAWVRIPSLSGSQDTTIRMQYGNPDLGSQTNPSGVWNTEYRGVWHLSENPAGTIYDSTSNNLHGTSKGTMGSSNKVNGKIDGALNFDGVNDYLDFGDISHNDYPITVSFWMKADARKYMNPIDKFPSDLTSYYGWSIRLQSDGSLIFYLGNRGMTGNDYVRATNAYSANAWVHVTCTLSMSKASIFINGNEIATVDITPRLYNQNSVSLRFGIPQLYQTNYKYDGVLDEVKLSNTVRSNNWIKTEFNNQNNPGSFCTVSGEFCLGFDPNNPFMIDVEEGNQYIYELVEKNENFKEFLPYMHELVNATYWMALLNYTQHMDTITDPITIVPIEAYFDLAYKDVLGTNYTVSGVLKGEGYPEILGISEWYGSHLNFGMTAINKILDGTVNLPGLVADHQLGAGVLEFLDLYDRAQYNATLKNSMLTGYGVGSSDNWYKLQALAGYYREYFIPDAIPLLEPIAIYEFPQIQYLDIMDRLFEGNEIKGDFTCSKIKQISNITIGWNVTIDKWDYSSNKEDFNAKPADYSQNITVYHSAFFLGNNVNIASLSLQDNDVIPIIVDIYLEKIDWAESVKRYGNTVSEIFYSGPIDPYPYDEVNLTYSMTYDNDGMLKRILFCGDVQISTHLIERIVFYELAFYEEKAADPTTDTNDIKSNSFDSRIIVLSSVSLTFALGLFYVLKKSKGFRR